VHVLELFIEHHTLPVDLARQTIEEQRRRILFELESPLPSASPESPTRAAGPVSEADRLRQRLAALQKQMSVERSGERRLAIRDQTIDLARRIRDLEAD
jgi:hypothetical protein